MRSDQKQYQGPSSGLALLAGMSIGGVVSLLLSVVLMWFASSSQAFTLLVCIFNGIAVTLGGQALMVSLKATPVEITGMGTYLEVVYSGVKFAFIMPVVMWYALSSVVLRLSKVGPESTIMTAFNNRLSEWLTRVAPAR